MVRARFVHIKFFAGALKHLRLPIEILARAIASL
jgi:hypothetical protein